MPNRILKESINESRGLTNCTFFAQDLYKRLITYADDYGRFNADPQIMVARLYPRELSVVSLEDLIEGLIELCGVGKIGFYTAQPRHEVYGAFPNWGEHQRLRESKQKAPDPTDTTANDWYLRRFIPLSMKVAIVERDGFKCKICGKHIAEVGDAKKLVKMGFGLFHIDHVVPCDQGGRATMENLRLTCPKCNLSRKKAFSYDEILEFAENCGELPQIAANCEKLQPESNPNPNPNPNPNSRRFTPPTRDEVAAYISEKGYHVDPDRWMAHYESNGWRVGSNPMKDWKAAVRTWATNRFDKQTGKGVSQTQYTQREYEEQPQGQIPAWLAEEIAQEEQEQKDFLAAHGLEDNAENRRRLIRLNGEWRLQE